MSAHDSNSSATGFPNPEPAENGQESVNVASGIGENAMAGWNGDCAISIKSLWKVFGKNPDRVLAGDAADLDKTEILDRLGCVVALQDASFDVGKGETFVVMGLSGSGKALLVSCLVGWACEKLNESQVIEYGLADVIELQTPGSMAALDAHITGAYEKGEPALFYYWGPTKIAAELDLTVLEEPVCAAGAGPESGCAYPLARVLIAVHPSLIQRAPDVVEMLRKWNYTAAAQVAAEGWMSDNEATSEEAAINFLKTQDVWQEWVSDDAAALLATALAAE